MQTLMPATNLNQLQGSSVRFTAQAKITSQRNVLSWPPLRFVLPLLHSSP